MVTIHFITAYDQNVRDTKDPKLKVKLSLYRPGQALRAPGGWGSQSF
jgi:hypothetical protein